MDHGKKPKMAQIVEFLPSAWVTCSQEFLVPSYGLALVAADTERVNCGWKLSYFPFLSVFVAQGLGVSSPTLRTLS